MAAGLESFKMAGHHEAKAGGLADALERSIFADDADALERLKEKALALAAEIETMKRANMAYKRAAGASGWALAVFEGDPDQAAKAEAMEAAARLLFSVCPDERRPFPAYALTNRGAERRRALARVAEVERLACARAEAEAAPGGVVVKVTPFGSTSAWLSLRFADVPAREVREALKGCGFRFSGGAWSGYREKLDAGAREVLEGAGVELPESAPEVPTHDVGGEGGGA